MRPHAKRSTAFPVVPMLGTLLVATTCPPACRSPADDLSGGTAGPAGETACDPTTASTWFDTSLPQSFFDFPWPSDARIDDSGHADMTGFPNPDENDILTMYLETMEEDIVGFGNNSPIYFRFKVDIHERHLPVLPVDSLEADASVVLVDVDPDSPDYGSFIPVHTSYLIQATTYSPSHLLAVAPAWGFPLRPATTYAAVVRRSLEDARGCPLVPDPGLEQLLSPASAGTADPALAAVYAPLKAVLPTIGIAPEDVAAATVFTTQDPVSDLAAIRDYIHGALPSPQLDPDLERPLWYVPEDPDYQHIGEEEAAMDAGTGGHQGSVPSKPRAYHLFEGRYRAPNFQEGDPPYAETGGAIRFDDSGDPIVQVPDEPIRFCLAVPKGPQPETGWPLAIYAHGTGGDYKSMLYSGTYHVADILTQRGVAVIGIDEPLHGERAPEGTDPELMSFNFLNPDSARSVFRQAAIDVFYLAWLCRTALVLPAEESPTGSDIRFDPEHLVFFGHSHGAIAGALIAPFETDILGSFLSEAGGGLSQTILLRKDYIDFAELFRTVLGMAESDPLDEFHPVMAVVQTLVDITDPINYAPLFASHPIDGSARTVVHTEGFHDEATPPQTIEAMAVAGRLPIIEPVGRTIAGLELLGISPASRPVALNMAGPDGQFATAGLLQFPDDNHYAVSRDYEAVRLYADFVQSLGYTGVATLP